MNLLLTLIQGPQICFSHASILLHEYHKIYLKAGENYESYLGNRVWNLGNDDTYKVLMAKF